MKAIINNLINSRELGEYKIRKSIENFFIKESIDTNAVWHEKDDFDYLLQAAAQAEQRDDGNIEEECENGDTYEKDVFIMHNEGGFDLDECTAEKKLFFLSPIDCIKDEEINIFDYPAGSSQTTQGTVETTIRFSGNVHKNYANKMLFSAQELISELGGIPDLSSEGYFIVYLNIEAIAEYTQDVFDPIGGGGPILFLNYLGHRIGYLAVYQRIISTTQHNGRWKPLPDGTGFYLQSPIEAPWKDPIIEYQTRGISFLNEPIWSVRYQRGEPGRLIPEIGISNTILINPILIDIFQCTGKQLVSNYFGINEDSTQPDNDFYDFAFDHCHDIKIVQSYDIIRENAYLDSFGQSGVISSRKLTLDMNKIFNLLIVYDSIADVIRWEHVTYFTRKGIDAVAQDVAHHWEQPLQINRDNISAEEWRFAAATPTPGFYQSIIEYNRGDIFDEENIKAVGIENFLTDVFGTINNVDFEQREFQNLFYLLCTDGSSIIDLNVPFSMNNIVKNCHFINRPLLRGKHDGNDEVFVGYSIGFQGSLVMELSLLTFDKLQPGMSVVTKHGTFMIETIEIDQDKICTFELKK